MNKLGLFATLSQFAPRLFQVRGRTWVAVGAGLLVLFGLLIWAAIALLGWFFGQAQGWMGAAPEAARGAMEQVERAVPGMREIGHIAGGDTRVHQGPRAPRPENRATTQGRRQRAHRGRPAVNDNRDLI